MIPMRRNSVFVGLLLLFVELGAGCKISMHPSDHLLEERLKSNQATFDALIKMLGEDKDIIRIDNDFVFLSEGSNREIAKERLQVYRDLFGKLRLEGGFHRDKEDALRFIASSRANFSNSEKSYVYCTNPRTPSVDSLDYIIEKDRGDQQPIYKKLHDNWYLYYESW